MYGSDELTDLRLDRKLELLSRYLSFQVIKNVEENCKKKGFTLAGSDFCFKKKLFILSTNK